VVNPEVSGYTTPFPLTLPLSPRGEGWGEGAELTKNLETKRLKENLNNLVDYRNCETAFPISIFWP
jgi:hypothetical protein